MDTKNGFVGVSILCLAYNHENYIKDALEGFLKQKTSFTYEIIVHEDASTDNTASIIRSYEEKYPDIIKPIYQEENQYSKGVNINDQFMLPKAKGKYVALCDGDDYWTDPLKLQKQYDAMEAHPECLMCLHKVIDFDTRKGENQSHSYLPATEIPSGVLRSKEFFHILGQNDFFNEVCYFFNAEAYREYQSHYPIFAQLYMKNKTDDAPMLYYFAYKADVYYLSDVMAVYRRFNAGSWSDNMKGKSVEEKALFFKNWMDAQNAFEAFSKGKYNEDLTYSRMYSSFNYFRCMKQYKKMLDSRFAPVWEKQSPRYHKRVRLLAKYPKTAGCMFFLYDKIQLLMKRISK